MSRRLASQSGRSVWPFVVFMGMFVILLSAVSKWYLLPALDAFNKGTPMERKLHAAHALLVMSLLLTILALCLVLMFRMGRYISPRGDRPPEKTKYTDAWAEAGKRMRTPKK